MSQKEETQPNEETALNQYGMGSPDRQIQENSAAVEIEEIKAEEEESPAEILQLKLRLATLQSHHSGEESLHLEDLALDDLDLEQQIKHLHKIVGGLMVATMDIAKQTKREKEPENKEGKERRQRCLIAIGAVVGAALLALTIALIVSFS